MNLRSLHLFCGAGGDGRGFADEGFEVTGIDVDQRALDDFRRLTGGQAFYLDLETAEPADLRRHVPRCPHILILSAPCKWASGLMSEGKARTEKYRRLASLTIRGMDLAMTAWPGEVPMIVLFENVPRIVSRAKKIAAEDAVTDVLEQVVALLQRSGYATLAQEVRAGGHVAGDQEEALSVLRQPTELAAVVEALRGVQSPDAAGDTVRGHQSIRQSPGRCRRRRRPPAPFASRHPSAREDRRWQCGPRALMSSISDFLAARARRAFARRFVAETPSWRDITFEEEVPGGWGSRREQLLGFAAALDLEVALEDLPVLEREAPQRSLDFAGGATA